MKNFKVGDLIEFSNKAKNNIHRLRYDLNWPLESYLILSDERGKFIISKKGDIKFHIKGYDDLFEFATVSFTYELNENKLP